MDLFIDDDCDEQSQSSSTEEALVGRQTIFVDPSCPSESPSPQSYVLDTESHPGYSQGTVTTATTPQTWDLTETFQSKSTAGGYMKQPTSIYEGNPVNDQRNNTLFVRLMTLSPDNKPTTISHCEKLAVGLTKSCCPNLPPVDRKVLPEEVNDIIPIIKNVAAASKSMSQFPVRNTSANCGRNRYTNGFTNSSAQVSEKGISPRDVYSTSRDHDMNAGFIDCSYSNSDDDLEKLKFNGISSTIIDIEAAKKVSCPLFKDLVKCESNSSLTHQNAPIEKVTIFATDTNSEALNGSNHHSSCSLSRFCRDASGQKNESARLNMKQANSPYLVDESCKRNSPIETLCSANTNSECVDEFMDTEDSENSLNSSDRIRHENLSQHSVDSNRQNIEPVVLCNLTSVLGGKFCDETEGNEAKCLNDKPLNPISKETAVKCAKPPQFGYRSSNRNSVDIFGEISCSKNPTRRGEHVRMNSGDRCILPSDFGCAPTSENDKNEAVSMVTSPVRSDQTVRCIFPEDYGQIVVDPSDGDARNEDIGDCMENLTLPLSEISLSYENCEGSTGRIESNKRISNEQIVRCTLPPDFGCQLSILEVENSAGHFRSGNSTLHSRENDDHKPNDEQTVKCVLPMHWVSDETSSNYENIGLTGTAEEVDSGPQSYCRPEWNSRRSEGLPKRSLKFSESTTTLRLEESVMAVESLKPDLKCMLPFTQQFEDDIHPHIDNCETLLYGVQLRESHATFVKSVPNFEDSEAQGIIGQVLGDACKEFVLENSCSDCECILIHNVKLNLELPERDVTMVHKIFTKWFLDHSKQPNFKVLLVLMSSLTMDYGSDLLFSILRISQAFFKLKQNYRRPFGIKLIERMINLIDLPMKDAIRTILTFTITRETGKADIEDLLKGLGIFEPGMACIFESISCIWHITDVYEFPPNILLSVLEECLQMEDISVEFKRTKDKIATELMKLPRSVLRKQFHQVSKFLSRFYPVNSQVSFNLNSLVFHGVIPEAEFDPDRKSSYKSCRVKSTGPINWDWEYWDLSEARMKACHLMMGKMSLENQDEEVSAPPHTTPFQNLNMDNLIDDDETISSAFLPKVNNWGTHESRAVDESTSIPIDDMNRIEQALNKGQFRDVSRAILSYNHPAKRKSLGTCLRFLTTLLARYVKEKLPHAIYEILALLPRSVYDDGSSIRKSFVSSVNSLVLIFYERADYKSALKLLKTLRVCGENALEYMPNDAIDPQTFAAVCSDIHLECRCFPESLRILLYGNCINYIKYNIADQLCMAHFFQLELVILKMFKIFLKERLASYALNLFRAILLAQRNLNSPMNIGIYYEVVLCHSFITTRKASCDPHAGANLYITVDRTCGNEVRFRTATYRSLLVKLLQASAPEDIVLRTLLLCQKLNVYPRFTLHSISLGTHLVTEEMYLYIFYFFKYFLEGNDGPTLLQKQCSIKMTKMTKPSQKPFPVLQEIVKVSNELPEAFERLKASFKRIVGDLFDDLYIDFSLPDEAIIPSVGIETILEVLLEDKRMVE